MQLIRTQGNRRNVLKCQRSRSARRGAISLAVFVTMTVCGLLLVQTVQANLFARRSLVDQNRTEQAREVAMFVASRLRRNPEWTPQTLVVPVTGDRVAEVRVDRSESPTQFFVNVTYPVGQANAVVAKVELSL